MTSLEQIDFVLFYIKEKIQYGGSYGFKNIWFHVEKTPETDITTPTLLKEILKRLLDDGFITETTHPEAQNVYHLTFKGVLFQGYKKEAFNKRVKNTLYIVSLVAVIIAGLYYSLEIYKSLIQLFC